jgi:hypothetical protein
MVKKRIRRDFRDPLLPRFLLRESKYWQVFPKVGNDDPVEEISESELAKEYWERREPPGQSHSAETPVKRKRAVVNRK